MKRSDGQRWRSALISRLLGLLDLLPGWIYTQKDPQGRHIECRNCQTHSGADLWRPSLRDSLFNQEGLHYLNLSAHCLKQGRGTTRHISQGYISHRNVDYDVLSRPKQRMSQSEWELPIRPLGMGETCGENARPVSWSDFLAVRWGGENFVDQLLLRDGLVALYDCVVAWGEQNIFRYLTVRREIWTYGSCSHHVPSQTVSRARSETAVFKGTHYSVMNTNIPQVEGVGVIVPLQDACQVVRHKEAEGRWEVIIFNNFICQLLERDITTVVRDDAYPSSVSFLS